MPQVSFQALTSGVCSGSNLISFPTDTVPALAARPDRAHLIFEFKQRSLDKPLILMAGAVPDLWPYVKGSAEEQQHWQHVADRYLPGALTMVLPASDRVPAGMNPTNPTTIGVRVPNHPVAQAILRQTGPLATTSVNRSGEPPLQTLSEIEAHFPELLTLLPLELEALSSTQRVAADANLGLVSGTPSTVARWTSTGWEILRQGSIVLDV